jgi:hypothetical protein
MGFDIPNGGFEEWRDREVRKARGKRESLQLRDAQGKETGDFVDLVLEDLGEAKFRIGLTAAPGQELNAGLLIPGNYYQAKNIFAELVALSGSGEFSYDTFKAYVERRAADIERGEF